MFHGRYIVFFSAVPWEGLYARPQQLCTRFVSAGARVLFVEPPWTLLSPLRQPKLIKTWLQGKRVRAIQPNLLVYTPPPLLPGYNAWRFINKLNQRFLLERIKEVLAELHWVLDLLWTHLPASADMPDYVDIIYDCVDDHAAFGGLAKVQTVRTLENDLLLRAQAVFASSNRLWQRCRLVRADACLVGNGADYGHFSPAAHGRNTESPTTIGFYGGIGFWVDLPLVYGAARRLPEYRFVMIGPVEPGIVTHDAPPNVEFWGLRKYHELPAILSQFDVTMIPFVVNEVTLSVNPLKLYEFFAAGKPVLVANTPELTRFGELVYPVIDVESFIAAVKDALRELPELKYRRQVIAQRESWENKVEEIVRHLGGNEVNE